MRILVLSDSHRDYISASLAVKSQASAKVIIHCGDGDEDVQRLKEDFKDRKILAVRGNCDFYSKLNKEEIINLNGRKIFITHGDKYEVEYGLDNIINKAKKIKADIVLFGHTHVPLCEYKEGIYIMNPGSIKTRRGTYGILDIEDTAVVMNIVDIDNFYRNLDKKCY